MTGDMEPDSDVRPRPTAREIVAQVGELAPGEMKTITLRNREYVLICRGPENYNIVFGRCPHQGGPMGLGWVGATPAAGAVGEYRLGENSQVIRCPWHAYEFDVASGRSLCNDNRLRLPTIRTEVEGDNVYASFGRG